MPRQVDHIRRRDEFAEAVWRIAADRGLEAASMSAIAAEAGTSVGRIQYYFASRDELISFATARLRELAGQQAAQRMSAAGSSPLARLRALLLAYLQLRDDERGRVVVAVALLFRALREPGLAEQYRDEHARTVAAVAELVRAAERAGELRVGLDAVREARLLLAVVTGVALDAALERIDPAEAAALIDRQLAHLSGPE